jgi:receptor protein-tyrosine kinase
LTTIERAINRLRGGAEPAPLPPDTAAPAVIAPAPAGSAGIAAEPVVPRPESVAAREPVKARASEAPALAPSRRPAHQVVLDYPRLVAGGFLTPISPRSNMSEEYQFIKRRLLGQIGVGQQSGPPSNLIMLTSALPGEGKTFTSLNLVMSLAMEVERTVLAVDTDVVKRDLSKQFGVNDLPGLFDLLADPKLDVADVLVHTNMPNLSIIPVGKDYGSPTEMLASDAMRRLAADLANRYANRVVLFDSPPVLAMTSAAGLAPLMGQVVLVVEAERTTQEAVREAVQALEPAKVTGVVLNKSRWSRMTTEYRYGYGYYYQPKR